MQNTHTSPTGIARNGNESSSHTKYTAILAHGTPLNIIPSVEKRSTRITQLNADGSTDRISGSAQREQVYAQGISENHLCTEQQLADGTILSLSLTNGFGETVVQAQPNTLGGFIYSYSEFNSRGQLVKTWSDTGADSTPSAPTLYVYDAMNNMVKQPLALTDAPAVSDSPMTETTPGVESLADGVYSTTTTTRYNAAGQPLSSVQKQLISGTASKKSRNDGQRRANHQELW